MPRYKEDDWNKLRPYFRDKLRALCDEVNQHGYRSHLADGIRTPEESRSMNDGKHGQLLGLSMHCFGVAGDVICFDHGWQCVEAGCDFYSVLHEVALRRFFTRVYLTGKKGRYIDGPHIQGVPVSAQRFIRQATLSQIDEALRRYLR